MKFFHSRTAFFLLVAVLIILVIFVSRGLIVRNYLETRVNNLAAKISELDKDNINLEKEKLLLDNSAGLEDAARRLYILKKPGEQAIVMPQDLLNASTALDISQKSQGFFQNIIDAIKRFFK